jgi:hypothetical protein
VGARHAHRSGELLVGDVEHGPGLPAQASECRAERGRHPASQPGRSYLRLTR